MINCKSIVFIFLTFILFVENGFTQKNEIKSFSFTASMGSHISKYSWEKLDDAFNSITFPEYKWRPGLHAGISIEKILGNKFYLQSDLDYMSTRTAVETGGEILLADENGSLFIAKCDYIDKRIHQAMLSVGAGYYIFPALSLEVNVFVNTDLAVEQSKLCDFVDWSDTYNQEKSTGFGLNPALVFKWKNFILQGSYGFELVNSRNITLTDEQGAIIGKFNNKLQYFSLRAGYTI